MIRLNHGTVNDILIKLFIGEGYRSEGRFFVPTCHGRVTPRAAAVKDGRRPPPAAARSVLDGGEHGVTLEVVGADPICSSCAR
jgi:hypothetical protein